VRNSFPAKMKTTLTSMHDPRFLDKDMNGYMDKSEVKVTFSDSTAPSNPPSVSTSAESHFGIDPHSRDGHTRSTSRGALHLRRTHDQSDHNSDLLEKTTQIGSIAVHFQPHFHR